MTKTKILIKYYVPMWTYPRLTDSQFRLLSLQSLHFSLFRLFYSFNSSHNLKRRHISFYDIACILLSPYFINLSKGRVNLWRWDDLFSQFYFWWRFVSFMEVLHRRVYFWYGYREQHKSHRLFHNLTQYIRTLFGFISFFVDVFY